VIRGRVVGLQQQWDVIEAAPEFITMDVNMPGMNLGRRSTSGGSLWGCGLKP